MKRRRLLLACLVASVVGVVMIAGTSEGAASPPKGVLGPFPTKKVTLSVWDIFPSNMPRGKAQDDINKAFMKLHPNVTIKHSGYPYAAYYPQKVVVALAARQGPDVLAVYPNIPFYKGLVPLNGLITKAQRKSLLMFGWDQQDPSLHQLPFTTYAYYFVYNKALFAKAGLSGPPSTWAELLGDCGKLNAAGIVPIAAGFTDGYYAEWLSQSGIATAIMSPAQLTAFNYTGKIGWTSPVMTQVGTLLLQLKSANCFSPNATGLALNDAVTQFTGKNAAMFYTYSGLADFATPLGSDLGVFPMPTVPGQVYPGHPVSAGAHIGYAITRFSHNCAAAWAYLSFLESPAAQKIEYDEAGIYPNNIRTIIKTTTNPVDQQVLAWLKNPNDNAGAVLIGAQEITADTKAIPQLMAGQISLTQYLQTDQQARQTTVFTQAPFDETPQCN